MTTQYGTDADDTLNGTSEDDSLFGGAGNDTLIGGRGYDYIVGGSGNDIAVFSGDRSEFSIFSYGDFASDEVNVVGESMDRNVVQGVEILRFDDQDLLVTDFFDDYGDTPETAGGFGVLDFGTGRLIYEADGAIEFAGDRDLFTLALPENKQYRLGFFDSGYPNMAEMVGIFGPNGDLVPGTSGEINRNIEFETREAGAYSFSIASTNENVGRYEMVLYELKFVGDEMGNVLDGTSGADIFFPLAEEGYVYAHEGADIVVLPGNRSDYDLEFFLPEYFENGDPTWTSVDTGASGVLRLLNVEILRFDDGDVSVLAEIDDHGDTPETAGQFESGDDGYGREEDLKAQGRIEGIGDTDLFAVELEADKIYRFNFREDQDGGIEVRGVTGPDGKAADVRQFPSQFNIYADVSFLRTVQSGTYYFSFAGIDENVGDYSVYLREHQITGTAERDSIHDTPFDDQIETGEGGDYVTVVLFGKSIVDGGAGSDALEIFVQDRDLEITASSDGVTKISGPDGFVAFSNFERVYFFDGYNFIDFDQDITDLLRAAGSTQPDVPFDFQFVDKDEGTYTDAGTDDQFLLGSNVDERIEIAGGTNVVYAGYGDDKVGLLSGTNIVEGGNGADLIIGGFGSDNLSGGDGDDVIRGDISANIFGSDTLNGGEGDDLLEGGGGQDTFVFKPSHGTDTIGALDIDYDAPAASVVTGADFESGLDKVQLDGFGYVSAEEALGKVTDVDGVATFSDQDTVITFAGLTIADLSPDDFIIV